MQAKKDRDAISKLMDDDPFDYAFEKNCALRNALAALAEVEIKDE